MERNEFTVHDRLLGPVTITGKLLVDKRFGSDRKPRWTDMALYQVVEMASDWHTIASCEGCTPPRTLVVNTQILAGAPITCGACGKPFVQDGRNTEKPFRYLLEITARSWVYHRLGSSCVKPRHMISTVGDVKKSEGRWGNLLPCTRCNAADLEKMSPVDRIAEERSDPHFYLCTTASAVVNRMYRHSGEISHLAARLLREAARMDPDIAREITGQRRI